MKSSGKERLFASIKFKVIPKVNPRKLEELNKYYATAISSGLADLEALTRRISRRSTAVSDIDIMADITDANVRFVAGKELEAVLKTARFEKEA